MNKLILSLFLLSTFFSGSAQVIFGITSNLCDTTTQHNYNYEYAGNINGGAIDWNTPDMTLDSNAIEGCLVLVNDGSTGTTSIGAPPFTVNSSALACDSVTFTQDLTGKIAVLYRGDCSFSLKAFNAQKRGAIGVIIINHTGAAVGMSGGVYGTNVTIPYWMIGEADGAELVACLDTVCTGVTGYFGNENPVFENDMATNKSLMLMTESSAMPWDLARNGTEYPVDLGLWMYNKGWSAQSGVTATVNISFGGNVVFTNTSTALNFNAPDTTFIDSQYVDLGTYAPANWNVGTYTITYTISNPNEEDLSNNVVSFDFKLTNNEDIYAKCRLDEDNNPENPVFMSVTEILEEDNWKTCLNFRNAYAGQRNTQVLGMTFSAFLHDSNDREINIFAYEWNDVFVDMYSPATYSSLIELGSASYTYTDSIGHKENIYLDFDTPILLQDNQRYLFCLHNNNSFDGLPIGYDDEIDYTITAKHYKQPLFPFEDLGYPNVEGWFEWYAMGFGFDQIPSISVTMDIATGIDDVVNEEMAMPYPNPATNYLIVPMRKNVKGNVTIELFDLAGKMVLSETQIIKKEPLKLNVSAVANGNYIVKLTFENAVTDSYKISINR